MIPPETIWRRFEQQFVEERIIAIEAHHGLEIGDAGFGKERMCQNGIRSAIICSKFLIVGARERVLLRHVSKVPQGLLFEDARNSLHLRGEKSRIKPAVRSSS